MVRTLALVCFAALGLSACATAGAQQDNRGWFFNADGGEARLAYGTPQSDDAPLMMSCAPGSGRVLLSQSALRPGDGLTLASQGRRTIFHGQAEADELNGGVFMTAETRVDTPVLAAFRNSGRIAIEEEGRAAELHATAEERAQIRRFFGSCSA